MHVVPNCAVIGRGGSPQPDNPVELGKHRVDSVPSSVVDVNASAFRFAYQTRSSRGPVLLNFASSRKKLCGPTVANVGAILDAYVADRQAEIAGSRGSLVSQ